MQKQPRYSTERTGNRGFTPDIVAFISPLLAFVERFGVVTITCL